MSNVAYLVPSCVVCGGGMNCEFCPATTRPRLDETLLARVREDRTIVGRETVLDVRDGRIFLFPRARR